MGRKIRNRQPVVVDNYVTEMAEKESHYLSKGSTIINGGIKEEDFLGECSYFYPLNFTQPR